MNILYTGWVLIKLFTFDQGKNVYYLHEPNKDIHINLVSKEKLPYGENQWVKLEVNAHCEKVDTTYKINGAKGQFARQSMFCNATEFKIKKCTIRNSVIVNGTQYC